MSKGLHDSDLAHARCPACQAALVEGNPFCVECGVRVSATSAAPAAAVADAHAQPQTGTTLVAADSQVAEPQVAGSQVAPPRGGPSPLTGASAEAQSSSALAIEEPTHAARTNSEPTGAPVVPLPASAKTQPVSAFEGATTSGEGPVAVIPDEHLLDDTPDFRPGDKVLSQYRIVRELGRGGMGAVYLAQDDLTMQKVAIKVLPAALAREKGIRERFTAEARALASLDHANIVPLISYAQEGDDRFLIMKYVEGTPLDDLIEKEGTLSFAQSESIFRDLISALGYAHDRGVIHRDIKPANVLIGDDGRMYLVDFGIAKKEESVKLTQTGMLMGTPQYMSPELISGHPVDGRTDLYAAGLILFEMLCGRPPFVGERTFTVLRAHVEAAVPNPVELRGEPIPTSLLVVIDRLLKKRPEDRPADADGTIAVLDAAELETPIFGVDPGVVKEEALLGRGHGAELDTAETMALAGQFEDEITAAFGKQRSRSLTAFAVGALALASTAIIIVVANPGGTTAEPPTRQKVEGEDEALTLLKIAQTKLDANKPAMALEMLKAIPGAARDLVPVVQLEVDCHLALRELDEAEHLLRALRGYVSILSDAENKKLETQQTALAAARKARADKQKKIAASRAQYPRSLTDAQILAVTEGTKSQTQLAECWKRTVLRSDPTAHGSIRLKAVVTPDGAVTKASILKDSIKNTRLKRCVEKAALRWRFKKVRGQRSWEVVATFDFKGEG